MSTEKNEKREDATEPLSEEQKLVEALKALLSFETIMSLAMGHLVERGYKLAQGPRGEFLVAYRSSPGMIKFSTALALEADAWFRKQAEQTAAEHPGG
jgi:hypothetical protein